VAWLSTAEHFNGTAWLHSKRLVGEWSYFFVPAAMHLSSAEVMRSLTGFHAKCDGGLIEEGEFECCTAARHREVGLAYLFDVADVADLDLEE